MLLLTKEHGPHAKKKETKLMTKGKQNTTHDKTKHRKQQLNTNLRQTCTQEKLEKSQNHKNEKRKENSPFANGDGGKLMGPEYVSNQCPM